MVVISEISEGFGHLRADWNEASSIRTIALLAADLAVLFVAATHGFALSETIAAWFWYRYGRPAH